MVDQPRKIDWYQISQTISRAFRDEFGLSDAVANDIGFHMTDWLADADELQRIFSTIDSVSNSEITDFVLRFLSHVPNHLNAAAKLSGLGAVEDVFQVGIFEDDE